MECIKTAIVYSKPACPQCDQAKSLLKSKNYCVDERIIGTDVTIDELFLKIGNPVRSVPQVFFIDEDEDVYVGGVSELRNELNKDETRN